jgi:L-alanine-DL-glutamate epimerase-like enolase superfamily enzyme
MCEMAEERGLTVVPHLWKTGISIAAATHLAAGTPHCRYIEFLPAELSESPLRRHLVKGEPSMEDGSIPVPAEPGLGIELDREAFKEFAEAAKRLVP